MRSLTLSLRQAYAKKRLRIGQIQTAFVKSAIRKNINADFFDELEKNEDVIQADELARIILFMFQQPAHINIRDISVTPTVSPV